MKTRSNSKKRAPAAKVYKITPISPPQVIEHTLAYLLSVRDRKKVRR